ncbi:DNA mismatch repair protein [Paenibacillaceae bacterium]|nr:DNA mismatch repair protein [Paenibacillaceae bacterium]
MLNTNHSLPLGAQQISREDVIKLGLGALQEIGSERICKVCIPNGGSCCSGCAHLVNGAGCQLRNTSCTAWLCGFLKFLLFETGQLQQWSSFWRQVPGQDYRIDFTPEKFVIEQPLEVPNLNRLSAALAEDLRDLAKTKPAKGYILELREKLDGYIDQYMSPESSVRKRTGIKRKLKGLTKEFHRYQIAIEEYRLAEQ